MRRYETIAIIDPDLGEDDRVSLLARIKEIITEQEGIVIEEDLLGTKKLAYEIKRKPRGYYARYDYCGMGPLVDELERSFRIDDRVLKYMTVQLDGDADEEQIKAEIAAAQAAKPDVAPSEGPEAESKAPASEDAVQPAPATGDEATASETTESETQKESEPADSDKSDKEE